MQKDEAIARRRELEEIASEPFAWMADDPKLEEMRRNTIRDGDPMAVYISKKLPKSEGSLSSTKSAKLLKPAYKGPAAPPNRFSIPPGYRWDAIDRGNGFEHKVLLKMNERTAFKEDEYRWSSADM